MIYILLLLILFIVILSLDIGLCLGVAYIIHWLLPDISFDNSILIGAICSNVAAFLFVQLVVSWNQLETKLVARVPTVIEEYPEDMEEEDEYPSIPTSSSRRKRRRRH